MDTTFYSGLPHDVLILLNNGIKISSTIVQKLPLGIQQRRVKENPFGHIDTHDSTQKHKGLGIKILTYKIFLFLPGGPPKSFPMLT